MYKQRRSIIIVIALLVTLGCTSTPAISESSSAWKQTNTADCGDRQNIERALDRVIKASNSLDKGWEQFPDGGGYLIERTVAVSKIMNIHYRWRVDNDGNIEPANDRGAELCSS